MWNALVKDEIWEANSFLSADQLQRIMTMLKLSSKTDLAPGPSIREKFEKSGVNATLYKYTIHNTAIRQDLDLFQGIYSKLDQIMAPIVGHTSVASPINPLQLFVKSFTSDSYYELHTEPAYRYGLFSFMLFLTDEFDGGELVFPDGEDLRRRLSQFPNEEAPWNENKSLLLKYHETARVIDFCKISPRFNKCVLFKTGSAHYVNSLRTIRGEFPRLCISGWPFATQELIAKLDENCHIKNYFEPPPPVDIF